MSFALSAGANEPQGHQRVLYIAGNNLANVNTPVSKSSRTTFSELLNETIKKASQRTTDISGINPQQSDSVIGIDELSPNKLKGNIINTGNPLDLAVEGDGYLVLSNGQQNIYVRSGSFAVDSDSSLVDPVTGYHVKRIGSVGEVDGFQTPGNSDIHIPYDVEIPAKATSEIIVSGNLSANSAFSVAQTHVITSNLAYTYNNGTPAAETTKISQLDQYSGTLTSGTITIGGYYKDGTAYDSGITFDIDESTTLGDLINHLNTNVLNGATASLENGKIRVTDDTCGYSKSDITLTYSGDGSLTTPAYFDISTVGGEESKNINITVYDSQGGKHVLSGAFVRTDNANTWDMVLTSITGDINQITMSNRRIENIIFDASDGSYAGLAGSDPAKFVITFENDSSSPQTIEINLGTTGKLDGLTQFAGNSTAVAREQNGYGAGRLANVSINNEGILNGAFTNGIRKNIATIQIALFQNPSGLESIGKRYYIPSANSGKAIATRAMTVGAGSIHSGALEKSNADVITEFANMIQVQNGFQANARSIRVANEILRELTSLIR